MPATYALECALTAQWASIGVRPSAVVGHGPGALAAAQAAGVFSLDEGLRLAVALGELNKQQSQQDVRVTLEGLEAALAGVTLATPSIPLVDNATGREIEPVDEIDVDYWIRQAQEPARLSGSAGTLAQLGVDVVVEIGPGSTGEARPDSTGTPVVPSTLGSPSVNGTSTESDEGFARAVASAYEAGLDISFAGLFAGEIRRRISIPGYPFQRRRHWI